MSVTASQVKQLRQQTGARIIDCKQALETSKGDFDKAVNWLREKGVSQASKKSSRIANEGFITSYVHGGRIGVLIEVNSETDFVAKNPEFQDFAKDLSLHITSSCPTYVKEEDVPSEVRESEKQIFLNQAKEKKKNEKATQMIAEGLYNKWLSENCLLNQEFIRDSAKKETVSEALTQLIAKFRENIVIRRFVRFELGEGIEKKQSNFKAEVEKAMKG